MSAIDPHASAKGRLLAWCLIAIGLVACAKDDMPPLVASSKYIDFYTRGDTSVICMDDMLAREDRFIEATAAALGVGVPTGRIHFVSDPSTEFGDRSTWSCETAAHCYWYVEEEDYGVILSGAISHHHELVHAVEIPALGEDAHRTLGEGVADYFGSFRSSQGVLEGFPEAFKAMVAANPQPSDYALAMHFVGSLIERYGVETYKELRAAMPVEAGLEEFASTFELVYGVSLDAGLLEMSADAIHGLDTEQGCAEGDGRVIPWAGPRLLETAVESECGDGWFVAGGGRGFGTSFVIEVPEAGFYELTLGSTTGSPQGYVGLLAACPYDTSQGFVSSHDGGTGYGRLYPGRHVLTIGFPPGPEARGEATIKLEFEAPLE